MPKKKLYKVINRIENTLKQVRIIPAGANDPLPPVPDVVELYEGDLDEISRIWDETMPEYAGMLDAEVVKRKNANQS